MSQNKELEKILKELIKDKNKLEKQNMRLEFAGKYNPKLSGALAITEKAIAAIEINSNYPDAINKSYSELKRDLEDLKKQKKGFGPNDTLISKIEALSNIIAKLTPYVTKKDPKLEISKDNGSTTITFGNSFGISVKGQDTRITINGQDINDIER